MASENFTDDKILNCTLANVALVENTLHFADAYHSAHTQFWVWIFLRWAFLRFPPINLLE